MFLRDRSNKKRKKEKKNHNQNQNHDNQQQEPIIARDSIYLEYFDPYRRIYRVSSNLSEPIERKTQESTFNVLTLSTWEEETPREAAPRLDSFSKEEENEAEEEEEEKRDGKEKDKKKRVKENNYGSFGNYQQRRKRKIQRKRTNSSLEINKQPQSNSLSSFPPSIHRKHTVDPSPVRPSIHPLELERTRPRT